MSRLALVVAAVVLAVGCSDSKSASSPYAPPGSRYTLSGVARAAPATVVDGDVADPAAPVVHNDDAAHAQGLPSVVTVGGFAGPTDPDVYRVHLAAGQVVTLDVANATSVDLDLSLIYVSSVAEAASSAGTGAVHTLTVPASEDYYVYVYAADPPRPQGSGNYVLTLSRGAATAAAPGALDASAEFVPGQVLVRFRDDLPSAAGVETAAARAASVGLIARAGGPRREMLMELPAGATARAAALATNGVTGRALRALGEPVVDDLEAERLDTVRLVKALRSRADVATADLNYIRRALAVPTDPGYGYQWDLPLMKLPQAWDVTTGTPASGDVVVAVVDTGVLLAHPDLSGQLVSGYDFISDPAYSRDGDGIDPNPDDPGTSPTPGQSSWHGTHVAGTIAARTGNGAGVAGVSWGAKIMPLRALGLNGAGTSYDIIQAVKYAAGLANDSHTVPARKADVINLSLGGPGSSPTEQAVYSAIRAAGVVVVAAAGNDNTNELFYPASYDGVISVSAVDASARRAPYSNYGTRVDVAAPGGDMSVYLGGYPAGILSTVGDDSAGGPIQMTYDFLQGTSMASPHVAGVVALMRSVCPTLTPDQLDGALTSGAITADLGTTGRDDVYGWGLIDAFAAAQWASDPAHCASTTGTVKTVISAAPVRLDFVPAGATSVLVTIAKSGTDAVTGVTVSGTPSWLSVVPVAVSAGLGTYRFSVATTGLSDGLYAASITFTASPISKSVVVPVTLQVGVSSSPSSAGYLYVLLLQLDPTTGDVAVVGQVGGASTAGAYPFTFSGVPAGTYYVFAGSDSDDDYAICDEGESCGAYPSLAEPGVIKLGANVTNLEFQVGFPAAIGLGSASRATAPAGGLARPPPRRVLGVTP